MEAFLGTVQAFAFNYAPFGWAACNGNPLSIRQNTALYALLGTNFGGDGVNTFNVPNLGGRAVVGSGQSSGTSSYAWAQSGGGENVTLTTNNMPTHNHPLMGLNAASTTGNPTGSVLSIPDGTDINQQDVSVTLYAPAPSGGAGMVSLASASIGSAGSGAAFSILQPYLALSYCIAIQGAFPSRN